MKIYSWNIYDENKNFERALDYISNLNFDILCLQEVPEKVLAKLKKLPYNMEYHIDLKRYVNKRWIPIYLVILTPHKITNSKKFYVGRDWAEPLRTKILRSVMKIAGWTKIDAYGALYCDIKINKRSVRCFSTHLRVGTPLERLRMLKRIFKELSSKSINLVCGDFNIADQKHIKILNWLLGSSLKEASPFYPDRENAEKLMSEHGLQNTLTKKRTHTLLNSQLDYILIPESLKCTSKVESKNYGSDHYPISVDVKL